MMKRFFLALVILVCLLCAAACASAGSDLTYTLLEDGSGYEISSCNASATVVTIPAKYKGLPVLSIAGEAFVSCDRLTEFRVEKNQPVFYVEDGVLFTDQPVKTLVRFPNAYPLSYYKAPADLKAVGPWAFAGQKTLGYLHFQDGLESFGDCMLYSANNWADIYVPASLKNIGKQLVQNAQGSIAFYGPEDSAFVRYAWDNDIPCGMIVDWQEREQTAELAEPDLADAEGIPAPKKTVTISRNLYVVDDYYPEVIYDFSDKQGEADVELRMDLSRAWREITPDAKGKVADGKDPRTGLYGIGFTGEETVLRGYDRKGRLTGTRVVNGDFVFALPDAYSIGVTGGKDTVMTILPYEPIVVGSSGTLPLDPEHFHYLAEDRRIQYYVIPFPYASTSYDYPFYMNVFGSKLTDAAGKEAEASPHYGIKTIVFMDPYLVDRANLVAVNFDHLDVLYENEDITCVAASRFGKDEEFGKNLAEILKNVKAVMSGVYYPADRKINHVTVRLSGEYPTSDHSVITLDESSVEYNEENILTYAHEMTHAVDQTVGFNMTGAWMEGRAEYISRKVCSMMGVHYWQYDSRNDWPLLSEEDRADFFCYYAEYTNRETEYSVGYFFFKYLCDTYGEDISAKIMQNLFEAAENVSPDEWKIPDDVFKKCVTDATDPDVFQNFVRDMVER